MPRLDAGPLFGHRCPGRMVVPGSHLRVSRVSRRSFDVGWFSACLLVVDQLLSVGISVRSPASRLPRFEARLAVHAVDHFETDLAAFKEEEVDEDGWIEDQDVSAARSSAEHRSPPARLHPA